MKQIRFRVILPAAEICVALLLFWSHQHYQPALDVYLGAITPAATPVPTASAESTKANLPTIVEGKDVKIMLGDDLQVWADWDRATFSPRQWIMGMNVPAMVVVLPVSIALEDRPFSSELDCVLFAVAGTLVWWFVGRFIDSRLGNFNAVRWFDVVFSVVAFLLGGVTFPTLFFPSDLRPNELADAWFPFWFMLGAWMCAANILYLIRARRLRTA